jgi:hypothetical protein
MGIAAVGLAAMFISIRSITGSSLITALRKE